MRKTNSTLISGTDVFVSCLMDIDDPLSIKDAEHFRRVATSRLLLIENTLKCPGLIRVIREHR